MARIRQTFRTIGGKAPKKHILDKSVEITKKNGVSKKRRTRKIGIKTMREIRKLQKDEKLTMIPKAKIEKIVREIAKDIKEVRFSKDVVTMCKHAAEDLCDFLFRSAKLIMEQSTYSTLQRNHLRLACFLTQTPRGYITNDVELYPKEPEVEATPTPDVKPKRKAVPPKKRPVTGAAADDDAPF